MPAVSKKQQKFFGIVRAVQKGEMAPTTPETAKAAADMKKGDVKKFASTKHKGLPEKKVTKEGTSYGIYKGDGKVKISGYEKLKKKIGSKNKHDKPVTVDEGVMDVVRKYGKKKGEKKPQKAMDAGARGRRMLQRREYASKISGSEDLVPDNIRDEFDFVQEGSLHKWFKGSKSKDGKGGWVNVVTGGTCASDEPGEGTPKCVSSAKRASMTKAERLSASRRKKKADPGQQQKSGAAKPTYVSTDSPRKKKMKKEHFDWRSTMDEAYGGKGVSRKAKLASTHPPTAQAAIKNIPTETDRGAGNKAMRRAGKPVEKKSPNYKAYVMKKEHFDWRSTMDEACWKGYEKKGMKTMFGKRYPNCVKKTKKEEVEYVAETKDKKGKGSGKKDACYHKVKASASVWPSAYASGRLVQCRKKGAANYGNSKKESYSWRDELDYVQEGAAWTKKSGKSASGGLNEKGRKSYERENPGSDLKRPQPEGGSRKKSFCARMGGMKKKLTSSKTANDPDSRINKALRKWKC